MYEWVLWYDIFAWFMYVYLYECWGSMYIYIYIYIYMCVCVWCVCVCVCVCARGLEPGSLNCVSMSVGILMIDLCVFECWSMCMSLGNFWILLLAWSVYICTYMCEQILECYWFCVYFSMSVSVLLINVYIRDSVSTHVWVLV